METLRIHELFEYRITDVKEGGMGRVLILERTSEASPFDFVHLRQLAAKTFKDTEFVIENRDLFERELNIWMELSVDNAVPLLAVVFIRGRLYALMPLYEHSLRDLLTSMRSLPLPMACSVLRSCIKCLEQAYHNLGVLHLDLKPENVLLRADRDEHVSDVADWGLAEIQESAARRFPSKTELGNSFFETIHGAGTLPYMSPERLIDNTKTPQADIYSLGLLFFEMLTGRLPFFSYEAKALSDEILTARYYDNAYRMLQHKQYDDQLIAFVLQAIHPILANRYASYAVFRKALDRLMHPTIFHLARKWFNSGG